MPTDRIKFLIALYFDKTISETQQAELSRWVHDNASDEDLNELLEQAWLEHEEEITPMPEIASEKIIDAIINPAASQNIAESSSKVILFNNKMWWLKRLSVAAVLLIIFSVAYVMIRPKTSPGTLAIQIPKPKEKGIKPGGQKAILTLSDGSKIVLDSAGNGLLTKQGGANIIKIANGQLQYIANQANSSETVYNTMSTPVGGQYQLVLPDGSNVWLNSSSSITYPTSFSRNERGVQITGEAYFEVAHDKTKPFHVSVNGMNVEVLGTHFNINSYDNESAIKTTLLEGKVKVTKGNASILIAPGQQAVAENLSNELTVKKDGVDLDQVIAWKNGKFIFLDDDIKSIMRQLERWYGITVSYSENVTNEEFVGIISRNVNLSQILDMLEKTGRVSFTIRDRNITVK